MKSGVLTPWTYITVKIHSVAQAQINLRHLPDKININKRASFTVTSRTNRSGLASVEARRLADTKLLKSSGDTKDSTELVKNIPPSPILNKK